MSPRSNRPALVRVATLLTAAMLAALTVTADPVSADADVRFDRSYVDDSLFAGTPAARPSVSASRPGGGEVWMADSATRVLRRFAADGTETQLWYGGLTTGLIAGIDVDATGNAWISTATDGYVFRIPPTAAGTLTPSDVATIDMGVSTLLGRITVASPDEAWVANATSGAVYRVSSASHSITGSQMVAAGHVLGGIELAESEVLLVADTTSNLIRGFALPGPGVNSSAPQLGSWATYNAPRNLTRQIVGGNSYWWVTTSTGVQRFDGFGSSLFWLLPSGASPSALTIDLDGTVWVGDSVTETLSRVPPGRAPSDGTDDISMGSLATADGLAVTGDGRVAVASDGTGRYIRVETDLAANPVAPPVLTGSATVGSVLSVTNGAWFGSRVNVEIAWYRCRSNSDCDQLLDGVAPRTTSTVPVTSAEVGTFIRARVTATNNTGGRLVSVQSAVVPAPPIPPPPAADPPPAAGPAPGSGAPPATGPTPEQWAQFVAFVRASQFAQFVRAVQESQLKQRCRRVGTGIRARTVCTRRPPARSTRRR